MADLGPASSISALTKILAAVTTQAYEYGSKVKNAKQDIENINRELEHVRQVLEKLKALAEKAEASGQPLDTWPTLIALKADCGPLAKCSQALLDLRSSQV
jgi:ABC-type transporter Mla subunit MlaD